MPSAAAPIERLLVLCIGKPKASRARGSAVFLRALMSAQWPRSFEREPRWHLGHVAASVHQHVASGVPSDIARAQPRKLSISGLCTLTVCASGNISLPTYCDNIKSDEQLLLTTLKPVACTCYFEAELPFRLPWPLCTPPADKRIR